jgi:cysteine desulfurase
VRRPIYLDYNATGPIAPEVLDAMLPFLRDHFGNPSSVHSYGLEAAAGIRNARRQLADLIGCTPEEILFTSGGTESDNLAIWGSCRAAPPGKRHVVTTSVEHPAVLEPLRLLEKEGWEVTLVDVTSDGRVDPDAVLGAIREDTALVSVMHANNETGALQPIAAIAPEARRRGAVVHTDAAQSVGKLPVHVDLLGVDLLVIAGHKFYGPKGVGALYVRGGTLLEPMMRGAPHESGMRSGTENVASIVGLGAAAALAQQELPGRVDHLRSLRDRLHEALQEKLPGTKLNGPQDERLPNTLNVSLPNIRAAAVLPRMEDIATASGAACHADRVEPSRVLLAMGLPVERALCALRLTVGRPTTEEEIDEAAERIATAAHQARAAGA